MRPHGTSQQLETRRRRAIALLRAGKTYRSVADTLSASLSSVVRWCQTHQKKGLRGLRSKPIPGRPPRLSESKLKELKRLLIQGPVAAGYETNLWTLKRIGALIQKRFGVRYHTAHVWKLMIHGLDWSWQKPERRAIQRDEKAIEKWKTQTWPHIKKRLAAQRPLGFS